MLLSLELISRNFQKEFVKENITSAHSNMESRINDSLSQINICFTFIKDNESFEDLFNEELGLETRQNIYQSIINSSTFNNNYYDIVFDIDGTIFHLGKDINYPSNSFKNEILKDDSSASTLFIGEINDKYIEIGKKYNDKSYLVFYLNSSVINNSLSLIDKEIGSNYIIDKNFLIIGDLDNNNGKYIFENSYYDLLSSEPYIKRIDGKRRIISISEISNNNKLDLYILSILDMSIILKDFNIMSLIIGIVAFVIFILAFILAFRLSKRIVHPINELSNKIRNVDFESKKGLYSLGSSNDELYELEKTYQEMLERLYSLMDINNENMEIKRKLEIEALTMQINPHFLYNTLDAIAWMAKIKKQTEIEKLVINLAKFFRLSLHKGDKYISLKDEIELTEHFLEIEKIRFPGSIKYEVNLDKDIENIKVLKLIIQPIVENAIKHGFISKDKIGTITINAYRNNDYIYIDVIDDGEGFIVEDDIFNKTDKPNGYGLYNINKRIMLEYKEDCGLSIDSKIGLGTKVTIKIKDNV